MQWTFWCFFYCSHPTVENKPTFIYEIKALLKQLNHPRAPDSIVGFLLDFEPFLEKNAKNVKIKKSSYRLDQHTNDMFQEWNLVTQSQGWITEWETQAKEVKYRVATCDANILY